MRSLILPAVIAASLAFSGFAYAGADVVAASVNRTIQVSALARRNACEAAMQAQRTRPGNQKAFFKACIARE